MGENFYNVDHELESLRNRIASVEQAQRSGATIVEKVVQMLAPVVKEATAPTPTITMPAPAVATNAPLPMDFTQPGMECVSAARNPVRMKRYHFKRSRNRCHICGNETAISKLVRVSDCVPDVICPACEKEGYLEFLQEMQQDGELSSVVI